MISDAARQKLIEQRLEQGRVAGREYLATRKAPAPRKHSPWSGPQIVREAEAAWLRGWRETVGDADAGE